MKQYNVTGMSCAACSASVEKAVRAVDGVSSCSVNLLTNSMGVDGTADSEAIIKAVTQAGYGASLKGAKSDPAASSNEDALKDTDTPKLIKRLVVSIVFLLPLMYISMGHTMWSWKLPDVLAENHIALALLQMIFAGIIMIINQKFFVSGFMGVVHKSPNMDTLVALGSGASFVYSTYALFAMTGAQLSGDSTAVMSYMHDLYFESAAMILVLITVGKTLEAYSKGRTTDALKGLMKLAPKTARVIKNGKEEIVAVETINIGDVFVVKAGDSVPVDGVVIDGSSAVDESALTGESIPVDKEADSKVSAGTINLSGYIKCRATGVGENTTLSQIIKMVSDASATKAPIAKVADKVSGVFVPIVIAIAIVTLAVWLLVGKNFSYSLARAVSVLVISCPCALGLATPVAVMVGSGKGAKNGILFKTASALEAAGKIQIAALDKTGTITQGKPEVTDILPINAADENELLSLAYCVENKSEHPLARAVAAKAAERGIELTASSDFQTFAGSGVAVTDENGNEITAGSYKFISSKIRIDSDVHAIADNLANQGKTPLFFVKNHSLSGIIAVADIVKADSREAVEQLQNMGIKVVMLTGDNKKTANAIAKQVGVDLVVSDVLPTDKAAVIKQLKKQGVTAMVGDGINDAPALVSADIGIAINTGTDIAVDSADIVLMNSRLSDVASAIRLSRASLRNIYENLFWAFIYNIIGIPLAAGVWIPLFGWQLNPMFGAAAMSLSSFCVVSNALRLNLFNIYNHKKDKKIKQIDIQLKEKNSMTKTIKIEGMMCPHCEANVKKTLEAFAQVDEAVASHENGTAVLTLNADIEDSELKKAIEEQGYKFLG